MKLEPTEAQRKAMRHIAGIRLDAAAHHRFKPDPEEFLTELIAAANSIPEGPPVGTIARRPDGEWIAWRTEDGWGYRFIGDEEPNEWPPGSSIADFWPQIRPDEWPEQVGLDWFPPGEEPIVPRPDPTAQQEPGAFNRFPGIENPTTSDYIGAAVADEQLKLVFALRDVRKERGLEIAEVAEAADVPASEISMFESGSSNPTLSLVRRYAKAVGAVFTVDVRKWEDTQPQREPALRERFPEQASAYVADPELAEVDDEPLPSGSLITPKPRTPRVVDRLGVDEQGSRWRDENGLIHSFTEGADGGRWKTQIGGSWYPWAKGVVPHGGEYTEILEPRVLASLAYNEAREGAVWSIVTKAGVRRLFQCQSDRWHTRLDLPGMHWTLCENFGDGPYTEVLGDPS
ncbi:XRE family transcriptional regulator [Mycobacteroides abscessus]|uniref:helix-turn-helix domain-containing protein n=1 Tax=Mycobacteroides abscessus TaxID=36809 RepID=UPI000D3EC330|nr:helix-turn-helix transcriptional regulator [Mycobacteroides abscessus]PVA46176.1 XRE family transcriptional regulator [Mycobacteroides abscessus]